MQVKCNQAMKENNEFGPFLAPNPHSPTDWAAAAIVLGFDPIFAYEICVYTECILMYTGHILTNFPEYWTSYQIKYSLFKPLKYVI